MKSSSVSKSAVYVTCSVCNTTRDIIRHKTTKPDKEFFCEECRKMVKPLPPQSGKSKPSFPTHNMPVNGTYPGDPLDSGKEESEEEIWVYDDGLMRLDRPGKKTEFRQLTDFQVKTVIREAVRKALSSRLQLLSELKEGVRGMMVSIGSPDWQGSASDMGTYNEAIGNVMQLLEEKERL